MSSLSHVDLPPLIAFPSLRAPFLRVLGHPSASSPLSTRLPNTQPPHIHTRLSGAPAWPAFGMYANILRSDADIPQRAHPRAIRVSVTITRQYQRMHTHRTNDGTRVHQIVHAQWRAVDGT